MRSGATAGAGAAASWIEPDHWFVDDHDPGFVQQRGGNDEPLASVVGEVIASNEFYDYNAKYIDNKSQTIIPADIPQATAEEVRRQAITAFIALDLSGLARVDFLLAADSGVLYLSELNTLPGFTTIRLT